MHATAQPTTSAPTLAAIVLLASAAVAAPNHTVHNTPATQPAVVEETTDTACASERRLQICTASQHRYLIRIPANTTPVEQKSSASPPFLTPPVR